MLLKCHLSLSRESRGNRQPKSIELCVSMERIAATPDRASAIDSITSITKYIDFSVLWNGARLDYLMTLINRLFTRTV